MQDSEKPIMHDSVYRVIARKHVGRDYATPKEAELCARERALKHPGEQFEILEVKRRVTYTAPAAGGWSE